MGSPSGKGARARAYGKGQDGSPGGTNGKAKGRRAREKARSQGARPNESARPQGEGGARRSGGVDRIGAGHPRVGPGTFDAEALLSSVLAVVEVRLEEGFRVLEEALAGIGDPASTAETARTAGRQIADAVRAGVVEGMRVRDRHLAQLAVIDRAAAQAENLKNLQGRIGSELELVGLRRISDLSDLSAFNLVEATGSQVAALPEGDAYELVSPAYMDAHTGRTVERGWIRRSPRGQTEEPGGKRHGRSSRPHREGNEAPLEDSSGPLLSPTSADREAGTARALESREQGLAEDKSLPLVQDEDAPVAESRHGNHSGPQVSDTSASDPRSQHVAEKGEAKPACAAAWDEDQESRGSGTGLHGESPRRVRAPGAIGDVRLSGAAYSRKLLAKPQEKNDEAPWRTS